MSNKYLSYDEDRAPKVREMFSRLAQRYDLVNDVMSFGMHRVWKRQTVRLALAGAPRNARVLDLCCGSGDLCFLAEELGAGSVVGADFTLPMLEVAKRRRRRRTSGARQDQPGRAGGRRGPQFVQADALRLPFRDGTFDVLTIGYGLRNVADIPAALRRCGACSRPAAAPSCWISASRIGRCPPRSTGRIWGRSCRPSDGSFTATRRPTPTSRPRSSGTRRSAASRP